MATATADEREGAPGQALIELLEALQGEIKY
jgi:hypothetical protein